jgi:Uma2 family endonuclease
MFYFFLAQTVKRLYLSNSHLVYVKIQGFNMTLPLPKYAAKYTYSDYLEWEDGERWELIEGEAYNITASPYRRHQEIRGVIFRKIADYLDDKSCKVFLAPFDVRLAEEKATDDETENVIQPDIVVVCDKKILDTHGCKGTPDLVVEIVSPSTASRDMGTKLKLYEKFRVREYWIVDPDKNFILQYNLQETNYYGTHTLVKSDEVLKSAVLESFEIELERSF